MRTSIKSLLLLTTAVSTSHAAVLATYFDGDYSTDNLSGSELAGNPDLTASDMSRVISGGVAGGNSGTMRNSFGSAVFTDSDASTGSFFFVYNGQNANATLDGTAYMQFTLTAMAGELIDLSNITLDWAYASDAASASGWSSSLDVQVSTNGGASFSTVAGSETTLSTGANVAAGGMAYFADDLVLDMSSLTPAAEYIVRIRSADSTGSASNAASLFQNVTANGEVVAIPEPTSTVLLGLGGFVMLFRRRR